MAGKPIPIEKFLDSNPDWELLDKQVPKWNYYDDWIVKVKSLGYDYASEAIAKLYKRYQSSIIIGKIFGVTPDCILWHLRRMNIKRIWGGCSIYRKKMIVIQRILALLDEEAEGDYSRMKEIFFKRFLREITSAVNDRLAVLSKEEREGK